METYKLAFIVDKVYPFYFGGYERRYYELATRLSRLHEVYLFTSYGKIDNIKSVSLFSRPISYVNRFGHRILMADFVFSLRLVGKFLPTFDFVDCNFIPPFVCWYPMVVSKLHRCAFIITVHETYMGTISSIIASRARTSKLERIFSGLTPSLSKGLIRLTLDAADHIFAVSKITAQSLRNNLGLSKVSYIPNGVNIELCRSIPPDARFASEECHIVFVGRFSPEKRIQDLLKAISILRNEGLRARLSLIGEGPIYNSILSLIRKLNIEEHVILHGRLDEIKKTSLIKTALAFVLPSEREGFSIAALEAMACGVPVIFGYSNAKDARGFEDYAVPGVNCLKYRCGDPVELAGVIRTLKEDSGKRKEICNAGLQTASRYDWNVISALYTKTLARLSNNY